MSCGVVPAHIGGMHQPTHPPVRGRRQASRAAFYIHLWIGVIFTVALLVIGVTGILLNHKRALGLMPDVAHEPLAPFRAALPLDSLAAIALAAVTVQDTSVARTSIDRMDVRPRNGFVKVRMRDAASTEVTVDLTSGRVLHTGPRGDVFFEKLHSGEAFGDGWILLSDGGAIALLVTLLTGYWLWLVPRLRQTRGAAAAESDA